MKELHSSLRPLLIVVLFLLPRQSPAQSIPPEYYFDFIDTDGNTHVLQDYFDQGKSVFLLEINSTSYSWEVYESTEILELYNTYGQGGTGDVVVLLYALSGDMGFTDYSGLSGLDFSDDLGPGYENLSYTDGNPIPIIMAADNDDFSFYGKLSFYLFCTDNRLFTIYEGGVADYMDWLRTLCCTPYEDFDPQLGPWNINADCDPSQINYTYSNGAPTPIDSIAIDVWLNGSFAEQIYIMDTLTGCGSLQMTYENELFQPGDEVELAIAQTNEVPENDSISIQIEPVDSVPGHLRGMVINPLNSPSGYMDTYSQGSANTQISQSNNYTGELFLPEGCHLVHFGMAGESIFAEDSYLIVVSLNENEEVLDTLIHASLDVEYFQTELNIYSEGEPGYMVWGYVYDDVNLSQSKNEDESGIEGIQVNHGSGTTFTDSTGYYIMPYVPGESIDVTYDEEVWPVNTTPNAGTPSSYLQHNFGLASDDPVWDLGFHYTNTFPILCEAALNQQFHIHNIGNQPAEGIFRFLPDPLLTPIEFSPEPSGTSGDTLIFEIPEIPFNGHFHVDVIYFLDTTLIGELLGTYIDLTTYDENGNISAFTSSAYTDSLFCSYDPNDIYGFPLGEGEIGLIEPNTRLDYRIRFQNTGNYPATHVEIVDTIPESLNLSSFENGPSSHARHVFIDHETRVVTWKFNNIHLPDSASDPEGSQGHLFFSIDMAEGLQPGDVIATRAHIYFDNNDPITTNTSLHTIAEPSTVRDIRDSPLLQVYPVPAGDRITIRTSLPAGSRVRIFDVQGRELDAWNIGGATSGRDIRTLENGIYFLVLTESNERNVLTRKLIIRH